MDHHEVGRIWDANAEAWTALARAGYDIYRDFVNTPAFMAMLPDVSGCDGLDVGCGEGHNTRLLAKRGARITAFDISTMFVKYAAEAQRTEDLGIRYVFASAVELPFRSESFDFVTAFMSLMDMPDQDVAFREIWRVLKPGGFLQFSMTHPCFQTSQWRWVHNQAQERIGVVCGDYFHPVKGRIDEWIFGAAPADVRRPFRPFQIPIFHRTLSSWVNLLIESGFTIERLGEPYADEKTAAECPGVSDTRIVAYFLHVRSRKAI